MSELQPAIPAKSIKVAYVLLITTGLFGTHRFYLGRWLYGAVYLLVFMLALIDVEGYALLALLGGVLIDAFLLPGLVRATNRELATEFAEHPEHFEPSVAQEIAPWAQGKEASFWQKFGAPLRVLQMLLLCVVYTFFMVLFESDEFVLFLVIILFAACLISSIDQLLVRYPALKTVPGFEDALDRTIEMRDYYWQNEPRLGASLTGMFTRARTEYKPYWKIVGLMTLAIVIDAVFSFGDDYSPYLSFSAAIGLIVLHLYIAVQAVLLVLSPVGALSFHYSLSGKQTSLRVLTIVALIFIGVTFTATKSVLRDPGEVSLLSQLRLEMRMEVPEFQQALDENVVMYLFYTFYKPDFPSEVVNLPECDDRNFETCAATGKVRELLSGIAPNSENQAFHVFDTTYEAYEVPVNVRMVRYKIAEETARYYVIGFIDQHGAMCSKFPPDEPPLGMSPDEGQALLDAMAPCVGWIEQFEAIFNSGSNG